MEPYTMDAELTVGFLSFNESYISKVTCVPYSSVEVRLLPSVIVSSTKSLLSGGCFFLYTIVQEFIDHLEVPGTRRKR